MSINLQKGQKINLSKSIGQGLKKIMVGLGWDEAISGEEIDCDASVILCKENGKSFVLPSIVENQIVVSEEELAKSVVYFGNLSLFDHAIEHQGDNRTGEGDGDDEQIMLDLERIPPNVSRLAFVVNIYQASDRGQHFGMIRNAYIRIFNLSNSSEICRFDLSENYNGMQGLIVGEIYRKNSEWRFSAVGQPVRNASYLIDMIKFYI